MKYFFLLAFLGILNSDAQINLNQGLVLYLPFSGNLNDGSGNGNNAINFNTILVNDQFGNPNSACEFNGSNSYLQILNNSTLQVGNEYTLCARVCPKGFYNGACFANAIIDKGWPDFNAGNYNLRFGVTYNPTSSCYGLDTNKENFTTQYSSYCGYSVINTTPYINLNNWYCVIGQFDGSNIKMYVDGVLRYQCSSATSVGVNTQDLLLGKHGNPSYPYLFEGIMDEVRIYNRVLNQLEIDSLCSLVVLPSVTADFNFIFPNICDSSNVQFYDNSASTSSITNWNWDFGDPASGANNFSTLKNPNHIFSTSGSFLVKLISTNSIGVSDTVVTSILVFDNSNFANAGLNQTICPRDSAQLQGAGGVSYSWSPSIYLNSPNISNPISNANATVVYTLNVVDSKGCSDTSEVTINVLVNTPLIITPDSTLCEGDSTIINATGGSNLIWAPSTYLNTNIGSTVICKPISSIAYTIAYEDSNHCHALHGHSVLVYPYPKLTLTKTNDIECNKKNTILSVKGANTFTWVPSSTLSSMYDSVVVSNPLQSTLYYVYGESNGCVSEDSIYVDVNAVSNEEMFIPNAFSPNEDNLNDCFQIKSKDILKSFKLKVYNRWGGLVFESNDVNHCWDGTTNGIFNELGVYYYYIRVLSACGEVFKKGDVLLVK